ncbi:MULTISPECIES: histidine kinase dimerization/phospho-acceptor domain-containing protein [unclassified Vibrio]|uniref:histidine kinase dimerization/phospho-acceptor domain-containing protein n=1 Tax=unclassified Vibrio TaxID=2614977 RepID=UPI001361CD28|nr:sensor histidine kinase [Vibrio sp. V36_P2S2PM302]NAX28020.1 sensor histidine kinase [Vibrio sp. V38_P2S17PM301]NAX32530.1 sensor histidine kinase [Vibrio sp. V37_P2S8PM304]
MKRPFLYSTKTLTGKLALFFSGVSLILGAATLLIFLAALQWSEDRVGERRIQIDRDEAATRFLHGENGKIVIDVLTDAYNDVRLVPEPYRTYIQGKHTFLAEVGEDPNSRMVLVSHYYTNGQQKPLILLTKIDAVEFGAEEMTFAGILVLSCVAVMLFIFGTLLFRLSEKLIEPINDLTLQLERHKGDSSHHFTIKPGAAIEFQTLADEMNRYRSEIHTVLKREQAFARYASHELRTPLTIIKGAEKLMSKNQDAEFQQRQRQRIDDATLQMSTMIDALLGLVRYERDESNTPYRMFTASELSRIVEQNSHQAWEKAIQIHQDVDAEPDVQASPAVMNMIVGNLIRNAIAATNQGEIHIRLTENSLVINDQGEGLDTTPNKDGHGLGLLIVDDLCRRYHWQFNLTNRADGGCRAEIDFGSPAVNSPEIVPEA